MLDVITTVMENDAINISEITGIVYEEVVEMIELLNSKDLIKLRGWGIYYLNQRGSLENGVGAIVKGITNVR